MGVLPLQFHQGETAKTLGLDGRETYTIRGIAGRLAPGQDLTVEVRRDDGSVFSFDARVRIDAESEVEYYVNGGIMPMVLRQMLAGKD